MLLSKRTKLAACAGMEGIVFDIDDLAEPERLNSFTYPGVTSWHSAMLSKDGSVTAMGWEPGGGVGPECEAGDPDFFKSIFFYDTESGDLLGTWVLPRPQTAQENCTIHNYNVIPNRKRDLLAVGAYQAGTYVVDFTDPARPKTVAWHDPAPVDPNALTLGGSWGSYWYNGFVYASDITKGVQVFRRRGPLRAGQGRQDRPPQPPDADLGGARQEEAPPLVAARAERGGHGRPSFCRAAAGPLRGRARRLARLPEGRFAQFCAAREREIAERRALLRRVALAAAVLPASCVGCALRLALVSRGRAAERIDELLTRPADAVGGNFPPPSPVERRNESGGAR